MNCLSQMLKLINKHVVTNDPSAANWNDELNSEIIKLVKRENGKDKIRIVESKSHHIHRKQSCPMHNTHTGSSKTRLV